MISNSLLPRTDYLCPSDDCQQERTVMAYRYRAKNGSREHIYAVPEDASHLDKWRAQNPDAFYSEPFEVRIRASVEVL